MITQLEVPDAFAAKVARMFGDEGRGWIEGLPELVGTLCARWGLTNLRVQAELSINFVAFADSEAHGACVLKVGSPNAERFTEIRALRLYGGHTACRAYETDPIVGASLLERIEPGRELWSVADRSERIRIGAAVIAGLPVPVPSAESVELPTYAFWLHRAFTMARAEGKIPELLLSLLDPAEAEAERLHLECRPEKAAMLLHGDLHHANILWCDASDSWRVIDPQGAVGPLCFEPARFMENELDACQAHPHGPLGDPAGAGLAACLDTACVNEMTRVFASALGETPDRIAAALFVDKVLSTCWLYEDNSPAEEAHANAEIAAFLFAHLGDMRRQCPAPHRNGG